MVLGDNQKFLFIGMMVVLGVYLLAFSYLMEIEVQDFSYPPPEPGPSPTDVSALLREAEGIVGATKNQTPPNSPGPEVGKERS